MKKGEMTRQRILELAAPLFNQQGFAGCSMADIMDATGLEKGGIYRYFESKEALAAEAFKFALKEIKKLRTDDLDHVAGSLNKLRYIMDRFISEPSPIKGGCALMNTAVDTDDGNVVLRELVREAFKAWRARLAAIVREGIESGEIQGSCQPEALADTLVAALEGALLLSRVDGDKKPLRHAREAMELVLSAYARR
jgi:TetR/AcrR family transcriptional regulator, transcriptional repressor for nem operon